MKNMIRLKDDFTSVKRFPPAFVRRVNASLINIIGGYISELMKYSKVIIILSNSLFPTFRLMGQ